MKATVVDLAEKIAQSLKGEDLWEALDALHLARTLIRIQEARHIAQSSPELSQVQHVSL